MAFEYLSKIPLQGLHSVRVTFFALFAVSSMIMFSFRTPMSNHKHLPRLRSAYDEDCKTGNMAQTRNLQERFPREPSRTSKIPSLSELKSLRSVIGKVITVIEGGSGVKSRNIGEIEKEPPPLAPSNKSYKPYRFSRMRTLTQEIRKSEIAFLQSLDKNRTDYYTGDFVRTTFAGNLLLKPKDAIYMNITRLTPAEVVPVHPLSQAEPYKTRLAGIRDSCQKHPNGQRTNFIDLKRIIRDDDHRVLLCVIPKAACTTWKSIMYYLTGKSTLENAFQVGRSDLTIDFGLVKSMSRLSKQGIVGRVNNFTKFMVIRHPFSRLVSAYRNKFERREKSYVMTHGRKIAQRIIASYLGGFAVRYTGQKKRDVLSKIVSLPNFQALDYKTQMKVLDVASRGYMGNVSFAEFLRFGVVADVAKAAMLDVHWRPQHFLCNPCAMQYDFVVRFEDLERESTVVLDYIQRNDPVEKRIKFPGGNPATVTSDVTKVFFAKIPPDLIEKLRQIYEKDFQYFSYDPYIF